MTRIKISLLIPFLLISILVNAQTPEVIGESISEKQKRVQYVENELIRPKQTEFDGLLRNLNLYSTTVYNWNYSNFDDKGKLQQHITKYQKIVDNINSNGRLFSLCNEINNLEKQINKNSSDNCKNVSKQLMQAKQNVSGAKARINQIDGLETKEIATEIEHQNKISDLDKELEQANDKTNSLDKELQALNNTSKQQSLDDFLATNTNSADTDDFLASPSNNSSNGSDDFLANDNEGSKSDFLSESNTANKDFKIEYKNGLTGVLDSKGKTLIPFKKWEIEEYKNGIAKVRVLFDEYKYEINNSEGYYGTVYKTGFVDISGSFLDDPLLSVIGGCYGFEYRLRLERSSDTRSEDEKDKAWARYDRKRELLKRECFNKFTQWKINTIKKYQ